MHDEEDRVGCQTSSRRVEVHVEIVDTNHNREELERFDFNHKSATISVKPSSSSSSSTFHFDRVSHFCSEADWQWCSELDSSSTVLIVDTCRKTNATTASFIDTFLTRVASQRHASNATPWTLTPLSCSDISARDETSSDTNNNNNKAINSFTMDSMSVVAIKCTDIHTLAKLLSPTHLHRANSDNLSNVVSKKSLEQVVQSCKRLVLVAILELDSDSWSRLSVLQSLRTPTNFDEAKESPVRPLCHLLKDVSSSSELSCSTVIYMGRAGSTGTEEEETTEDSSSVHLPSMSSDPRNELCLKETLFRACVNRDQLLRRRMRSSARRLPMSANSTPMRRQRSLEGTQIDMSRTGSLSRHGRGSSHLSLVRSTKMPLQGLVAGRRKHEVMPSEAKQTMRVRKKENVFECWFDSPTRRASSVERTSSHLFSPMRSKQSSGLSSSSSSSTTNTTNTKKSKERKEQVEQVEPFAWLRSASDLQRSSDPSVRLLTHFRTLESSDDEETTNNNNNLDKESKEKRKMVVVAHVHQEECVRASSGDGGATLRSPSALISTGHTQLREQALEGRTMSTFGHQPIVMSGCRTASDKKVGQGSLVYSDTEESLLSTWPMPEPLPSDKLHFLNTARRVGEEKNGGIDLRLERLRHSLSRLIHRDAGVAEDAEDTEDTEDRASLCSDPGTTSACESSMEARGGGRGASVERELEVSPSSSSLLLSLSLSRLNLSPENSCNSSKFDRLRDLGRDYFVCPLSQESSPLQSRMVQPTSRRRRRRRNRYCYNNGPKKPLLGAAGRGEKKVRLVPDQNAEGPTTLPHQLEVGHLGHDQVGQTTLRRQTATATGRRSRTKSDAATDTNTSDKEQLGSRPLLTTHKVSVAMAIPSPYSTLGPSAHAQTTTTSKADTSSNDSGLGNCESVRLRSRLGNGNNVVAAARSRLAQCGSSGYESFNDDFHPALTLKRETHNEEH